MNKEVLGLIGFLSVLSIAHAEPNPLEESVPPFVSVHSVSGEIKIWGSPADGPLLKDWAEGFRKFNPNAEIVTCLHGPESTMAGVYTGVADLAFMEREMRLPLEHMAFTWVYLYPPFSIEIANAGVRTARLGANLGIFVNRNNPLNHLTLTQLDGVFGAEHKRGTKNIRTWGDLGLDGSWKHFPIHVYGPAVDSPSALYLRQTVLKNSFKWNPEYKEFEDDDRDLLAAVADDLTGIAYAPLESGNDGLKLLALAEDDQGPFVDLAEQTVSTREYPLTRVITMVLNRAPGKPIETKIKEFLRFILSREGQAAITKDGAYVSLSAASLRRQLERLD